MNVAPFIRTRQLGKVNVDTVTLAHGGGGKAMKDLIDDVFVAAFDNHAAGAAGGSGAFRSRRTGDAMATGWRSPPTPSWSIRCSFPAATSASSRFAAPSTISRSAGRRRCICPAP